MTENAGFLAHLGLENVSDPNAIPDGKYPAFLFEAKVQKYKDDTRGRALILTYKIDGGPQNGKTLSEFHPIDNVPYNTEQKKGFLKKRLESLGIPESRHGQIGPNDLEGLAVNITKKQNGDFQNVSYVELRSASNPSAQPTPDALNPGAPAQQQPVASNLL